ncbi:hypothetical protein LCGC14_2033960 [marine sediment metagenome]|uniref:Uncharacterized protein n=1 Tax=marine sediment metagenome TaxID=412755 RepID=A0A0F9ETS5_9ZZZZ
MIFEFVMKIFNYIIFHLMDIIMVVGICWGIGWIILFVRKRIKKIKERIKDEGDKEEM